MSTAKTRQSRRKRPTVYRHGEPVILRDGKGTFRYQIMKAFQDVQAPYARTDHIAAYLGADYDYIVNLLSQMRSPENDNLISPDWQWDHFKALNRKTWYQPSKTKKAADYNERHKLTIPHLARGNQEEHDALTSEAAWSLHTAKAHIPNFGLLTLREMMQDEEFPAKTRELPNPAAIALPDGHELEPDYTPFVPTINGNTFFSTLEADRDTETGESRNAKDKKRQTWERKLVKHFTVMQRRLHASQFNAGSYDVYILTISQRAVDGWLEQIEKLKPGKFARNFRVRWIPDFHDEEQKPAGPWFVTEPWQTIDGPINLLEL